MSNPEKTSLHGAAGEGAAETESSVPVPDYEAEQYVLGSKNISDVRISVFRREFGFIRAYFKARPEEYWELQQKLNQARYGITYDVYLTRGVVYAAIAGFLGALLGLVTTWGLAQTGIIGTLEAPLRLPAALAGVVQFISANRVIVVGATAALVGLILFATITWFSYYYYPYSVASQRGREMNIMLPHTIVYMYALSFGGMGLVEVLKRTAAAEDTYGEVSNELDMIVRDVEFFGNDLFTAIRNARNLTPSDPMEQFLDDLLTTLDSGGNMTAFFRDNSEKYMEEAQSEQETFLETLATLSEVFIVLFVAAPLFVIVMLMVMSFLGANTITPLFVIIYAVVPLVMAAYFVVISVLSEPYKEPGHDVEVGDEGEMTTSDRVKQSEGYQIFQRLRARARFRDVLRAPVKRFKQEPTLSLYISVPAALIAMGAIGLSGYAELSIDAFLNEPFVTTTALAVVPFLIATVPFTLFHEANERRKSEITERLPDMLDILASANQMGVQLSKGFDLVSRNVTGYFATEIKRVRNDINWNHDVQTALLSLAARLRVPQLTRTCKILAEGSRSTGNLHRILDIAADDTRHRYRMKRDRKQELQTYTAIVIMGFLVYLGVIVVLDNSFLQVMINQFEEGGSQTSGSPIGVDLASLELYTALFYHSALIQGIGTGLISGKLASNQAASGLKYSIALVLLAVAVFALL